MVVSSVAAGPPAVVGYRDYRAHRANARALAKSDHVSYRSLAQTLDGHDVGLLTIGTGKVDEKPAILLVSGVNPTRLVDTEVTLRVVEQLVKAAESDDEVRGMLDRMTFYVITQAAPDAVKAFFEKPLRERDMNARPVDDDTDGQADEDGPNDLNGDGLITMMRVEDADGEYIAHPDDDRVMIEADPKKGERGRYQLYVEGRDDDGDGKINEDPPGGVAFDRNFTFDYPYFQRGAGPHQVSEVETRAVADFAFDHPNIVLVWTLSDRDNLLNKWEPDESAEEERIKTTLLADDAPYFDKIAEAYEEILGEDKPPETSPRAGAFVEWAYFHYGRWSVATRPWSIPPGKDEAEADEDNDNKETEEEEDGKSEEDERGVNDLNALAWFEQRGVDGFVDWQAFEHPDLEGMKVEIGGFKPFLQGNPPADLFDGLAEDQYEFLLKLGDMLPRVKIEAVKAEALGADVWRVTARVVNEGALPTVCEMGQLTREPQRLQIELKLPEGVSFVTGHGRRTIGPLAGEGGREEEKWLVRCPAKKTPLLIVRVWSPMVGCVERQTTIGSEADGSRLP